MTARSEPYEGRAIKGFAGDLTAWRQQMGLTKADLAARLGYDASLVGQFEACKNIPSRDFAEDCDSFFHTPGSFVRHWEAIEEERGQELLPPGFPDFVTRECAATWMYVFEPAVLTGLFQTPDYARAVLEVSYGSEEIERLIETRMSRQRILVRKHPPQVVVVFEESAIRRMVGSAENMRTQYRRLIEIAELPNVTLYVIPASKGAHAGLPGAFTILGFAEDPEVVYTEGYLGGQFNEDRCSVQQYRLIFDLIRGAAMSADGSLGFLYDAVESL